MRLHSAIIFVVSCFSSLTHATAWHDLTLLMKSGIKNNIFPGGVALIYHQGNIVYHHAFGHYTYNPHSPKMSTHTLFDVASLTKLMTTTSAMLLCDKHQLSLEDPVYRYLPAFGSHGKKTIRIRHLLTHTSGLDDKAILASKPGDDLIALIAASKPTGKPGSKFMYNDSDMLILQAIIETITQQPFEQFVHKQILRPLGMRHTLFNPKDKKICAPTRACAKDRDYLLHGEVDDDRAYIAGGVAGHAGLFSTASDFAQYMRMILHDGSYTVHGKKRQLIHPQTVHTWTSSQCDFSAYDEKGHRGYGFEIGRHLSPTAFGHFGWSGTSVWADRENDLICVLFTNSIHPTYDGREKMKEFRVQFHNLVVKIIGETKFASLNPSTPLRMSEDTPKVAVTKFAHVEPFERLRTGPQFAKIGDQNMHANTGKKIITGAEQTAAYFPLLAKKRVAILTNHTACIGDTHLVDALRAANINIVKIFTPEHGFRGEVDAEIEQKDSVDAKTGISLISIYGPKKKPSTDDLKNVDIILFDIQDVGARFYTYISSLHYVMEAAAEHAIPLMILDRPNPNGFYVDGPICEVKSFVGTQPIPIVHGMTVGEYAQMLTGEQWLANKATCNLTVIPCKNYSHKDLYTLPIFPSPNLKTMNAIYLYPSLCLFEGTKMSIGHGTEHPFEQFGHPSFPKKLKSFTPHKPSGKPTSGHLKYAETVCYGYNLVDSEKNTLKKLNNQITITWLQRAYDLYKDKDNFFTKFFPCLAGNRQLAEQIRAGLSEEEIRASWQPALNNFKKIRKKYLLYEDFE